MEKQVTTVIILCCFSFYFSMAQKPVSDSTLTGVWKGTSICQVKNSPCHDEVVVYHITKAAGLDSFDIAANKIVNAVEEEMGTVSCKLDRKNHQLLSTSHNGIWKFNIVGSHMDGILIYNGSLYRIINVSKQF